ncbi:GNAT family N-acetyltransferase [Solitalea sp. MAHUQ-68]|uniref:GNAT family N-acetyltransferase n=1 Tax=Solitalea agri TaxID=2953739 RepID=A0A9X2F4A0_9SPHI|nr:GNAT family N-acetyltransferase [Solitalea agri]MCO4294524.1 GNAT family N-acetyltransferase [Solitalea agri]
MHVKFISVEDTFNLRQQILKPGCALTSCYFPKDNEPETFHLAVVDNNEIVSVGSFNRSSLPFFANTSQYHLKGMATSLSYRGKNAGSTLVKFAMDYLKQKDVNLLWCNARVTAVGFYQKLGFTIIGDTFEVEGIGLHQTMYINLN